MIGKLTGEGDAAAAAAGVQKKPLTFSPRNTQFSG